ncbi:MAG: ferritin-like domain-containing protein [Patiriisocius sp.]|uniref:ferritin-like domain-containing protein n=1 Tax=Patiriisocius sp. TaxID=2822396 RepID=UPI003EF97DBD
MKTTLEEAKEKNHDKLVSNLQGLLEKNYDAEKGFKNAMENAEDKRLKSYLKQQAAQRNRFATELDSQIHALNEKPKQSGSITGTLHRTWMDVKNTFTGESAEAVLEECIRGEKASVNAYEETLKENSFTPEITQMLTRQASEIKETLSSVKKLEDIADNWS